MAYDKWWQYFSQKSGEVVGRIAFASLTLQLSAFPGSGVMAAEIGIS